MVFQERRFENDRAVTSAEAFSVCSNINNLVSEVGKSSVKVPCGGEYFAKETDSKGPTLWRQVWVDARPSLNDCATDDHERASAAKIFTPDTFRGRARVSARATLPDGRVGMGR